MNGSCRREDDLQAEKNPVLGWMDQLEDHEHLSAQLEMVSRFTRRRLSSLKEFVFNMIDIENEIHPCITNDKHLTLATSF